MLHEEVAKQSNCSEEGREGPGNLGPPAFPKHQGHSLLSSPSRENKGGLRLYDNEQIKGKGKKRETAGF